MRKGVKPINNEKKLKANQIHVANEHPMFQPATREVVAIVGTSLCACGLGIMGIMDCQKARHNHIR